MLFILKFSFHIMFEILRICVSKYSEWWWKFSSTACDALLWSWCQNLHVSLSIVVYDVKCEHPVWSLVFTELAKIYGLWFGRTLSAAVECAVIYMRVHCWPQLYFLSSKVSQSCEIICTLCRIFYPAHPADSRKKGISPNFLRSSASPRFSKCTRKVVNRVIPTS